MSQEGIEANSQNDGNKSAVEDTKKKRELTHYNSNIAGKANAKRTNTLHLNWKNVEMLLNQNEIYRRSKKQCEKRFKMIEERTLSKCKEMINEIMWRGVIMWLLSICAYLVVFMIWKRRS